MVSGYRLQRERTMRKVAGVQTNEELRCQAKAGCPAPRDSLTIAHVAPDEFTGYAKRSGGANYSRWMTYVGQHPENYRLECPACHSQTDDRIVPGPHVHRQGYVPVAASRRARRYVRRPPRRFGSRTED